jgi:hypothetical protein
MVPLSVEKIKVSPGFIEDIRFDITPRLFVDPKSAPGGKPVDLTHGYMLYIELKNKRPVIMVTMESAGSECAEGMYPLGDELTAWLKKELNIS